MNRYLTYFLDSIFNDVLIFILRINTHDFYFILFKFLFDSIQFNKIMINCSFYLSLLDLLNIVSYLSR